MIVSLICSISQIIIVCFHVEREKYYDLIQSCFSLLLSSITTVAVFDNLFWERCFCVSSFSAYPEWIVYSRMNISSFNTPFQINQGINNKVQVDLFCSVHDTMRWQHVLTPWVCVPIVRPVNGVYLMEAVLWKNPPGFPFLGCRPCGIVPVALDLVTSEISYQCS